MARMYKKIVYDWVVTMGNQREHAPNPNEHHTYHVIFLHVISFNIRLCSLAYPVVTRNANGHLVCSERGDCHGGQNANVWSNARVHSDRWPNRSKYHWNALEHRGKHWSCVLKVCRDFDKPWFITTESGYTRISLIKTYSWHVHDVSWRVASR